MPRKTLVAMVSGWLRDRTMISVSNLIICAFAVYALHGHGEHDAFGWAAVIVAVGMLTANVPTMRGGLAQAPK